MGRPVDINCTTSEESISLPDPLGQETGQTFYSYLVERAIIAFGSKGGLSKKAIIQYAAATNNVNKKSCAKAVNRAILRLLHSGVIRKSRRGLYRISAKHRALRVRKKRRRERTRRLRRARLRRRKRKGKRLKKKKRKLKKKRKRGKKRKTVRRRKRKPTKYSSRRRRGVKRKRKRRRRSKRRR